MKFFIKFIFFAGFICFIALGVLAFRYGIEETAFVEHNKELTFENIKKVKQIIKNIKSAQSSRKQVKKLRADENELNLLLSYAISHGLDIKNLFARARLSDNNITIFLTIRLPKKFSGKYINCRAAFRPKNNLIALDTFQICGLTLPELVTAPILSGLHYVLLKTEIYESLWSNIQAVKKVAVRKKALTFYYTLNIDSLKDITKIGRSFLLPDEQQQKLVEYHNHLSKLTQTHKHQQNAVLGLVQGLFSFAQKNSKTSHDPVIENKTAIQVLSLYVIGQRLDPIVKSEFKSSITSLGRTNLLFHNRTDLPKHFFVSAALAVSASSRFAGLVGVAKEIDDSDGGSGFSFADLAADKAGVKFGELAIASAQKAILFQEKIRSLSNENDLIPSISNLPEGIMELEFKRRYKDLDSNSYKLIDKEIDKRLNQCSLYQE